MSMIDLSGATSVAGVTPGLRAYVATPDGDGPWPGVVVVHEAFGVDDVMRRQADRLAAAGYLAVLPDLFSAGGPVRCLTATFRAMRSGSGRAFADIEAARQWLLAHDGCTGRTGVIGFCMGGSFALLTATRGFVVSAPNYAFLPKDLDAALVGACPVVASYGGADRGLRGTAAELEAGLQRAGIEHDVKEYPGAGHSFLNDAPSGPALLRPLLKVTGAGPHPESAADAWRRIEAFFATHLS